MPGLVSSGVSLLANACCPSIYSHNHVVHLAFLRGSGWANILHKSCYLHHLTMSCGVSVLDLIDNFGVLLFFGM